MNTGDLPVFQKQKTWSLQNHFMKKKIDGGEIYITVINIPNEKRIWKPFYVSKKVNLT